MTRLLSIGDLHSGHVTGLTHPDFDSRPSNRDSPQHKLYQFRRKAWKLFTQSVDALRPIHILLVGGDMVDGRHTKNKAKETLFADRSEQASNAAACINYVQADENCLLYGSDYHVGVTQDDEDEVAKEVENLQEIGCVGQYEVEGWVFNAKHYIGRSSIPHGRFTQVARDRLWNLIWSARGEYPKAHIVLRYHVHYFTFCGEDDWTGFTNPSLQGKTRYGTGRKGDLVHWGMLYFDIEKEGITWKPKIYKLSKPHQALVHLGK
jgi:hypothetical protein